MRDNNQSELSSKKEKHQSDLRVLALKLDKAIVRHRLLGDGTTFLDDPKLRPQIEENWRFVFQEPLFPDQPEKRAQKSNHVQQKRKETESDQSRPRAPGGKRRQKE